MNAAVVYFSLEGNTRFAAERIAEELRADLIPLLTVKKYPANGFGKYFWAGKSASFREAPALEPYRFDADRYDVILLGTPIWAGTFSPPLRTSLRANPMAGRKIAFFASCSGGSADQCFRELKKRARGGIVLDTLRLVDPAKGDKPEEMKKILDFCARLRESLEKA